MQKSLQFLQFFIFLIDVTIIVITSVISE